jgi:hypothetical protein
MSDGRLGKPGMTSHSMARGPVSVGKRLEGIVGRVGSQPIRQGDVHPSCTSALLEPAEQVVDCAVAARAVGASPDGWRREYPAAAPTKRFGQPMTWSQLRATDYLALGRCGRNCGRRVEHLQGRLPRPG